MNTCFSPSSVSAGASLTSDGDGVVASFGSLTAVSHRQRREQRKDMLKESRAWKLSFSSLKKNIHLSSASEIVTQKADLLQDPNVFNTNSLLLIQRFKGL